MATATYLPLNWRFHVDALAHGGMWMVDDLMKRGVTGSNPLPDICSSPNFQQYFSISAFWQEAFCDIPGTQDSRGAEV